MPDHRFELAPRAALLTELVAARCGDDALRAELLELPTPDLETNNPCTQRLAAALGLPAPGAPSGGS